MEYTIVQRCPVPKKLAPVVIECLEEARTGLTSCARGDDVATLLARYGKKSQRVLWDCYQRRLQIGHCPPECGGDCNPANPPGNSTHEGRNDGIAFRWWPRGWRIPWWAYGLDIFDSGVAAFIRAAARRGYTASVTYPGSRSEYHHVNFRKAPRLALRPLRLGMQGPRVATLTRQLRALGYLKAASWRYNATVVAAVRHFQRVHGQHVDGIVGPQTLRQIKTALRAQQQQARAVLQPQGG